MKATILLLVEHKWFKRWNVATLIDVPTDYMLTKDIRSCIIYSFTDKRDENAKIANCNANTLI